MGRSNSIPLARTNHDTAMRQELTRPTGAIALGLILLTSLTACQSGRSYDDGILTRESTHLGIVELDRDEQRVSYSLLAEPVLSCGSTWSGNFYTSTLGGAFLSVNVPGSVMLFYPTQFADLTDEGAHVFGIGSGDGDLRVSVLYGLLSLGRNWNFFWLNGFWFGQGDPMFSSPPSPIRDEFRTYVTDSDNSLVGGPR